MTTLDEKINLAAAKIDGIIDFSQLSQKISHKVIRVLVGFIEAVDKQIFKVCLSEVVDALPEKAMPVVESWLDAFNQEDYLLLVDATGPSWQSWIC